MQTYSSWTELIKLWAGGAQAIRPQRVSWQYRVEDDVLIWREEKLDKKAGRVVSVDHGVGYPATKTYPRMFYYDITNWRVRLAERTKLEELGGVPVLPFELVAPLVDADRPDLLSKDRGEHDFAALEHAKDWVQSKGSLSGGLNWRKYRIETQNREFHLAMRVRTRLAKDFIDTKGYSDWVVGAFTDSAFRLLGQTGRNTDVGWIRDAIYAALSRQLGAGLLPDSLTIERLGFAGCGAKAVEGGTMEIFPTPTYLTEYLYKTGAVNG